MVNEKDLIVKLVSDMIAQEFIKKKIFGVCLPTSILLQEQLIKLGLNFDFVCGLLKYDNEITPIHFWITVDDVIYDGTRKITQHWMSFNKVECDLTKFEYYPKEEVLCSMNDFIMLEIFTKIKETKNPEEYFEMAPDYLKEIRANVNGRVNKLFKRFIKK